MKRAHLAMITALTFGLLVSACATPQVISIQKVGDGNLSCEQIKQEFVEAQEFEKNARREKGVTGTNVAAGLFFWPALLATYSNIDEAVDAARDRQDHLKKIAEKNGCTI